MTASWAVAIAEPGRDFEVDVGLRRSGFRSVCLSYRKLLTANNRAGWQRSGDFVWRPLFPGYLFVQLWPGQPHPVVELVRGYAGLIDDGRRALPADLLCEWHRRVMVGEFDDNGPQRAPKDAPKFMPANDPEERRKLLAARFAEMLGEKEGVA